jgi:ankyrin repeat protein
LARAARNAHLHCLDLLLEAHAYEPAALADLAALGWPNPISKPAAEIIRKHLSQRFPHDPELAERARFRPPPPAPASSAADFELLSAASSTRPDAADKADKALARGARPDAYDDNRMSAVHWASSQGKSELLRKLLELGANPGLADEDGNTPAHYAAANAHIDCLRALIEREAPMGQLDNKGEYPITLCVAGAVPKGHEPGWRNALQYSVTSESYNPGTAPAFEECFELLASPENLGSIDIDAFRAAPSLSKINPDERERRVALCERAQILEALRDDRDSVHDEPARATSHRL